MFEALKSLFKDAPEVETEEDDGRLALAGLLVAAARQDDNYQEDEQQTIERILARQYELPADETRALRSKAEAEEEASMGLFRFTQRLKETTPFEDRIHIIEDLWDVVLSDDERHEDEDHMIRRVCGLLGVADRESGFARQRVEARKAAS